MNSLLKSEEIEWVVGNSESKLMLVSRIRGVPSVGESVPRSSFDDVDAATPGMQTTDRRGRIRRDDDDAIIIYTSGTTGKPKGCLLTHGNLIANARQIAEWMGFGAGRPAADGHAAVPHERGFRDDDVRAYAGGSTVVSSKILSLAFLGHHREIQDHVVRLGRDDAVDAARSISSLRSAGELTAKQPHALRLTHTTTSRFAMCGSAPVPAEVLKRFEETFDCLVIEGYGLSRIDLPLDFQSAERETPARLVRHADRQRDERSLTKTTKSPDGELGEIVMRGANIFKGYFKNPEATAKAFANGWFHTGDIGYRDADGFFYIADRKSDMIIRGGENIYPREIDDVLYTHPAVAAAAVIGVPDDFTAKRSPHSSC